MKLDKITQQRKYSKGTHLVYKGTFYEVVEHVPFMSMTLKPHIGQNVTVEKEDMDNIYLYGHNNGTLRWLFRIEQLGELKKYRIAQSKDSGNSWDALEASLAKHYREYKPICGDLKLLKGILSALIEQEELEYLARLGYWQPIK